MPGRIVPVVLVALGVWLGSVAPVSAAEESRRIESMETQLERAVNLFELGRYQEARAALDRLVAMDPSAEEAWKLRKAFSDQVLGEMAGWVEEGRTLGRGPLMVLERAQRFEQGQMLAEANIRQVVERAVRAEPGMPMGEALLEIAQLGQRAVPELVRQLTEGSTEAARVNAAYILTHLGRQAGYPLSRCLLAEDPFLVQNVCSVLADIRPVETRAVPFLKALVDSPDRPDAVRQWATRALEAITGRDVAGLPSAAELFRLESDRYYLEDAETDEEVDALRGDFWVWDPDARGEGRGALRPLGIPRFTLDDMIARELSLQGLAIDPADGLLQVQLASILFQQAREAATVDAILALQGLRIPGLDVIDSDVAEWMRRTERNERLAWAVGPDALGAVIEKSLADSKHTVSVAALEAIERTLPANALTEGQTVTPLMNALESPDVPIRAAAANCLARIGIPAAHAAFGSARDALVEGTRAQSETIALVISNDPGVRSRLRGILEKRGVRVTAATDGALGAAEATRFPPKDGIFLDAELAEFSNIEQALRLVGFVHGSPLPLVIIAPEERADTLGAALEGAGYAVDVRGDVSPATEDLYGELAALHRQTGGGARRAVLLVNGNIDERRELKQSLLIAAERSNRVGGESELVEALGRSRPQDDIFSVRPTMLNVFLSDELGGFNAMRTLQELRQDPRSRHVPVTLLAPESMMEDAHRRFRDFLEDADARVRILSLSAEGESVFSGMQEMRSENPVSQRNYTRQTTYRMALRSARSLVALAGRSSLTLSEEQVDGLRDVVSDRARPEPIRTEAARVLGLAGASRAAPTLAMVFREEPQSHHGLRVACLEALGLVDRANEYDDVKRSALDEDDLVIQQRAAAALALAGLGRPARSALLAEEMPNDPVLMLGGTEAPAPPPVHPDTPAPSPRVVLDAPIDSNVFEMTDPPAGRSSPGATAPEESAMEEEAVMEEEEAVPAPSEGDSDGGGFMEAPAE